MYEKDKKLLDLEETMLDLRGDLYKKILNIERKLRWGSNMELEMKLAELETMDNSNNRNLRELFDKYRNKLFDLKRILRKEPIVLSKNPKTNKIRQTRLIFHQSNKPERVYELDENLTYLYPVEIEIQKEETPDIECDIETFKYTGKQLKENVKEIQFEHLYEMKPKWKTIDKCRCYATATSKYFENIHIPIYNVNDNETKFNPKEDMIPFIDKKSSQQQYVLPCGVYWLQIPIGHHIEPMGMELDNGYYPHFVLNQFLLDGQIEPLMIKSKYIAKQHMKGKEIAQLIDELYDILPNELAKQPINTLTGLFNKKYTSKDTAFLTSHLPFAIGMLNYYNEHEKDYETRFKIKNDMYWVRHSEKTRLKSDTSIIYQYILGAGILSTYQMAKDIWNDDYQLIGIKTDGLYIVPHQHYNQYPDQAESSERLTKDGLIDETKIPMIQQPEIDKTKPIPISHYQKYPYKLEQSKFPPMVREREYVMFESNLISQKWNNIHFNEIAPHQYKLSTLRKLDGAVINAPAGAGKTHLSVSLYGEKTNECQLNESVNKQVIMLGFQGSVVGNWKNACFNQNIINDNCFTIDSFFGCQLINGRMKKIHPNKIKAEQIAHIFIDEKSQNSHKHMKLFVELKEKNDKINFWFIGDFNQCQAIEKPLYKIDICQSLQYLCNNNYVSIDFNPKFSRYDKDSRQIEFINYFNQHHQLHPDIFTKDDNGNYTYENNDIEKTKFHITAFRKGKTGCTAINKQKATTTNSKMNNIGKGNPIICNKTYEDDVAKLKISTGEPFTALEIDNSNQKVLIEVISNGEKKKHWFPVKDDGVDILLLGFSETIYRFQGQTMEEPMTIQNGEKMSFEAMTTAISRPRTDKHLFFSNLEQLRNVTFESAYSTSCSLRVPANFEDYDELNKMNRDISKPMSKNEYCDWVLYDVIDDEKNEYVGITQIKDNDIRASLDKRLENHLKSKGKKYESAVLEMTNPNINPYYQNSTSTIYGTRKQVEQIEQAHIRMKYQEIGDKLKNRYIQNLPKVLNEEQIEELHTHRNQLESILNKITIKPPTEKTRKYVFNNKNIAQSVGYTGRQIKIANLDEMKTKVETGIMRVVFGLDECNKPENVELFNKIKQQYQDKNKYLTH